MPSPNDLVSMFGTVGAMPMVMDQYDQDNLQNQVKTYKSLQDAFQADQTNPLEVQKQALANQETQARIPGVQAQSSLLGNKAKLDNSTFFDQLDAEQRKHVLSAKEDDLKLMETAAQKMMYDPDPKIREQGKALYLMKGSIVAEQAKQRDMLERQAQLEQMKQAGLDRRAQLAAQAKLGAQKKASALKLNFEQAYNFYTDQAAHAKTAEEAAALNELAENARQNWVWARQNKPVDPNAVNLPGVANLPGATPTPAPAARGSDKGSDPFAGFSITPKK